MCSMITDKYERRGPRQEPKIRDAIRAKELQLAQIMDQRITKVIAHLKGF